MTTSHDAASASRPADLTTDLPDRRAPLVRPAELPVSEHAIRVWCAAVGETNPIYHDDAAARQAAYSGVVAPGAMLQTWTMPVSHAARQAAPTLHAQIRERACESGYRSVVATDYEQEYLRPIHPGALLTELSWVDAVSPAKQTALGPGRFVTIAFEIRQADGAAVGRVRSRTLYFDPAPRPTRRRPAAAPEPLQGERLLVPLRVPLTRSLIVAASLASNDHEPVHHDHESARRDGLPDVIASIVTTAGLVLRYIGERHSRDTRVRRLRLNLAAPAMPGDVLTFRGVGDGTEVVVLADHARGRHVRAELQLGPPGRFAES